MRGPNVMLGYYKMPEDTASALAGGWLHTGDLGMFDAEGTATSSIARRTSSSAAVRTSIRPTSRKSSITRPG